MCDENDCLAFICHFAEHFQRFQRLFKTHARRWFVRNEQLRVCNQSGGNEYTSCHTARKLKGIEPLGFIR